MDAQTTEAEAQSEAPASNHVAAAAPPAAAASADLQQDAAEAMLHSQHTGEEDEIAEVDPQNRYYRWVEAFHSPSSTGIDTSPARTGK